MKMRLFLAIVGSEASSHRTLNQYPLDFIEADLVIPAIVKTGGSGALIVGHLLPDFELAAIAQILRDAGRAEGVTTDLCRDAGGAPRGDRSCGNVGLAHPAAGEDSRLSFGHGKQPRLRVDGCAFNLRRAACRASM